MATKKANRKGKKQKNESRKKHKKPAIKSMDFKGKKIYKKG